MSKKFIYVNSDGEYQETPNAFEVSDHVSSSSGVADAGKPIVLDSTGMIDISMETPAGSNTEVQFNDNEHFGADSDFTWNKLTQFLKTCNINMGADYKIYFDYN